MGFYCPPNGSTPDYIVYHDFESWLAYGMVMCWLSHDPSDPNADSNMSRPVTRGDVEDLRDLFLNVVEFVVEALWTKEYEPGHGDIDGDQVYVTIAKEGENGDSYDHDATHITWRVRLDDDSAMFVMDISGSDDHAIWLAYDSLDDRLKVLEALQKARATMNYSRFSERNKVGKKLVALAKKKPPEKTLKERLARSAITSSRGKRNGKTKQAGRG